MKARWVISALLGLVGLLALILVVGRLSGGRVRQVVEEPTVILEPRHIADYPRPPMYPNAKQINIRLTTRSGCIDNCDNYEPMKGLSTRITEFLTSESPEDVLSFYKQTLLDKGWVFVAKYSGYDERYHYKGKGEPLFSFSVHIYTDRQGSHVQLVEKVFEPFTWPE
jgi:hypothetical protein